MASHGRRPPRGAMSSTPGPRVPRRGRPGRFGRALAVGHGTRRRHRAGTLEGSAEVEAQCGLAPAAHALSAEAVGVAVDPPAAHPESARDIAHPDQSVRSGRAIVFDVLAVERHDLNREEAQPVVSVDAGGASPPLPYAAPPTTCDMFAATKVWETPDQVIEDPCQTASEPTEARAHLAYGECAPLFCPVAAIRAISQSRGTLPNGDRLCGWRSPKGPGG